MIGPSLYENVFSCVTVLGIVFLVSFLVVYYLLKRTKD